MSERITNLTIDQQIYAQGARAFEDGFGQVLSELYLLEANRALWRKGWEDASEGVSDPPTHARGDQNHEMSKPTYVARCVRSGDWWGVDIADASGTHLRGGNTQAKNLAEAEDKAREVIALLLNIPEDSFEVRILAPDDH